MTSAGMDSVMAGESELTLFAPTVQAFADFADSKGITLIELFASPDLETVLKNHVVEGIFKAADLSDGQVLTTLAGGSVTVGISDAGMTLNGSVNVTEFDIMATNTVIHVIDAVLEPTKPQPEPQPEPLPSIVEIATSNDDFSILVAALQAADLVDALSGEGPFTVFAPTNDAFAALLGELGVSAEELLASPDLKDILLYHVAAGSFGAEALSGLESVETLLGKRVHIQVADDGLILNGSIKVTAANIEASNGIVHIIDGVLLPPQPQPEPQPLPSIVDIVVNGDRFSLLEAALSRAGLVEALSGEGPFTVFAPTNQAFRNLAHQLGVTPEELLELPNLADILLYHVSAGVVTAEEAKAASSVDTLQGSHIGLSVDHDGNLRLNGHIRAIQTDIRASNGIVHVIDGVLLPPQ